MKCKKPLAAGSMGWGRPSLRAPGTAPAPRNCQTPRLTRPQREDITAAMTLLKEAGYDPPRSGQARPHRAHVLYWPDVAQLWVAQMKRNLGLDIEMKLVDVPTAVNTWVSGNFDLGSWGYGYNITDPDDYINAIYGPGVRNYHALEIPAFLELFDHQLSELDQGQAVADAAPDGGDSAYPRRSVRGALLGAALAIWCTTKFAPRRGRFLPAQTSKCPEMGSCLAGKIGSRFEVQRSTFIT